MPSLHVVSILTFTTVVFSELVEGPQPVLQKTVAALFGLGGSEALYPGACRWLQASPRQTRMCSREPALTDVLAAARDLALNSCLDSFRYDRWNCSTLLNNKPRRNIFTNVYRETALVHALVAASITHAVARACAAGTLRRCACAATAAVGVGATAWKRGGCGDDLKHGRRVTTDFLELKRAGADHIAGILKRDIGVGVDAVASHMREVCKCHGFSGSCTTKTCWRRVGAFNSSMAALKRQYRRAVRTKLPNYTSERRGRRRSGRGGGRARARLEYLQRGPNLCAGTHGRRCRDPDNCATLCCGRGYSTRQEPVESRCRCRMVACCLVRCDVCKHQQDVHFCK